VHLMEVLVMITADEIINLMGLKPLFPEGGYYVETYRSPMVLDGRQINLEEGDVRELFSAIYYLLAGRRVSRLHRLRSDEIYHLYLGGPLRMLLLYPDGIGEVITLGVDLAIGQRPQVLVPAGVWQGSWLEGGVDFAFMGTTMAPAYNPDDFELAEREKMVYEYPQFEVIINRLT